MLHSYIALLTTDVISQRVIDRLGLSIFPSELASKISATDVPPDTGTEFINSDFSAFLDDGNSWTPDHVATAVAALEDDPGLAAVYTSVRRLQPDGSEMDTLGEPSNRDKLKEHAYLDANSIVVRRSSHLSFSVLSKDRRTLPKEDWPKAAPSAIRRRMWNSGRRDSGLQDPRNLRDIRNELW